MKAEELLKIIRKNLDDNEIVLQTSPIMYDPIELYTKVSFAVMENIEKGTFKRFTVTVEDHIKPKI